jgi:hypothetical protein
MTKIFDYLKIAAVLVGVLIGVQIPAIIDQYGKNLDSRLSESSNSIAEFQDDADKYFDGDLNKLIAHYESKNDPVIVSGGESIGALLSRNQTLIKAQARYRESTYSAYAHVLFNPIKEIRADVRKNYTYSIVLNKAGIIAAVVSGLGMLMLFELGIFLLVLTSQALNKSSKRDAVNSAPS